MSIIIGTNAGETLNGTASSDIILAGNGNDTVNAGGGDDVVTGGNANDVLNGDAGNDIIDGGNGNDTINGGTGNDILLGGNGDDTLDGGSGNDALSGGNGNDILIYRATENVGSIDVYDGGNGQDTLRLIVSQAMANSAIFQADIAALQAKLNKGSASYSFNSFDLVVTSIEKLQVVIEAGNTNHAPTVAAAIADQSSAEDAPWSFMVPAGTFADVDGNTLTLSATLGNGTALPAWLTFNAATKTFSGTPPANFNGQIDLKVTASDGSLSVSDTFTLTITAVNDAPVAANDTLSATEDTPITFTAAQLLGNDTDADGNALSIASVTSGTGGTAVLNANGTVTFTPGANFNGAASFTYKATDGVALSNSATVTVNVAAVNDPPVAANDTLSATEDTPITFTAAQLLGNDTDADGNALSIASVTSGTGGTAVLNANGTVTFTPGANFNGAASFTYKATDGVALSNSATVTVNVAAVNDPPRRIPFRPPAMKTPSSRWRCQPRTWTARSRRSRSPACRPMGRFTATRA